jgi:WD40 repeat protein
MRPNRTSPAPIRSAADPRKTHLAHDLKHERPLICCRFAPGGAMAFAGSEEESVVRWQLDSGAKSVGKGHESWVFALAFSPDGRTLLSGGGDGRLLWWDPAGTDLAPARAIQAHHGWINTIAVSPDGQTAATAGNDRVVRLWSLADGLPIAELPGHERPVYVLRYARDGRTLFSADLLGRVVEWDLSVRKEARRLDAAKLYKYETGQGVDYGGVRDMDITADGSTLACSGLIEASNPLGAVSNPAILLVDLEGGKEPRLQRPKEDLKGVGWSVRCHPEGFLILASGGTGGGWLWFFEPAATNEFHKVNLTNTGRGLDLHPDGLRVATAHHDGHLRIWSMTEPPPKAG